MELRIGVVGTGAIGQDHINRIMTKLQGARVVAVTDINAENANKVAEKYGVRFFENGEDMIASPEVDAVIVTSWDPTHEKYVMESIKNGKYVFCEKPLAEKVDGCKRLVEAEMAGGKQLVQVGYMRRYDAGYLQLKDVTSNRKLGEPLMLHCAHRNPYVDGNYDTPMAVENSAVHEFDVLRWLLGEDYVSAQVVLPKKTRHSHAKLHDPQIIMLETKSGVRIDIEVFVNCKYGYDIKCEVCCEDGIIFLPEPANPLIRTNAARSVEIFMDWKKRFVAAYDVELQQWINSTKAGRVDGPTAWDGYMAAVTASACSKARDTQTIVPINMPECPDFYK